jgi:restriction system protein
MVDNAERARDLSAIPTASKLTDCVVEALRELGGSGTNEEIERLVAERAGLTPAQLVLPHDPYVPTRTEFAYRMAWARTRLRQEGAIERLGAKRWALSKPLA